MNAFSKTSMWESQRPSFFVELINPKPPAHLDIVFIAHRHLLSVQFGAGSWEKDEVSQIRERVGSDSGQGRVEMLTKATSRGRS